MAGCGVRSWRALLYYIFCFVFAIVMILPLVWAVLTSIKPDAEIFRFPPTWLPSKPTFEHYITAFTTVPFGRYFLNSLFLATTGVLLNLFFGSLSGYAFAKLQFRGRDLIFRVLVMAMMIPGIITLIPTFLVLKSFPLVGGNDIFGHGGLGFLDSYWAVIIPGASGSFAVFFMRQFFLTLPNDLMEAARIDGCSEFRIYWNIYLPQTKPALATLAIFTFQAGWNNFLWPIIVLSDPNMATVQMGLQSFSYNYHTNYGAMMAAACAVMLPVVILFIYLQRFFIQGIAFSGIK